MTCVCLPQHHQLQSIYTPFNSSLSLAYIYTQAQLGLCYGGEQVNKRNFLILCFSVAQGVCSLCK